MSGAAVRVRRYTAADREDVISLWDTLFPDPAPRNAPQRIIDEKLGVDDLLFVAEEQGVLVGAALAGWDGHRGWLYHVAVHPDRQRQGVGRALVTHILETLAARGCRKVNLQVVTSNRGVVPFYEALGFRVEERVSMGRVLASPDD